MMDECVWKTGSTDNDGNRGLSTRCKEKGCTGARSSVKECHEFLPLKEELAQIRRKEAMTDES